MNATIRAATLITASAGLLPLIYNSSAAQNRPYLAAAVKTANWLDSVAIPSSHGLRWPTVPQISADSVDTLYSGNAGVVFFYLYLHRATSEPHYLDQAVAGANALVDGTRTIDSTANPSLWTGLAGIGFTLSVMHDATGQAEYLQAAQRCFEYLRQSAKTSVSPGKIGVAWNDVTDLIGGSAGIGLYLLHHFKKTGQTDAFQLAVQTGDGLLAAAKGVDDSGRESNSEPVGLKWMMTPDFPREMPNYSHGTAGICDFLLVLDRFCKRQASSDSAFRYDGRFLKAARLGGKYLVGLMQQDSRWIPHHRPSDEPLYYLGWCHGPAGTAGFLHRLSQSTGTPQWAIAADELTEAMIQSGIPEHRPPGFWNNVGVCCGNAGVAAFLIDRSSTDQRPRQFALARRLVDDLLQTGTPIRLAGGKSGLFWSHAEHRVKPEFLQAQTGLMQGAAGIGLALLKMDAADNGQQLNLRLPVSPF